MTDPPWNQIIPLLSWVSKPPLFILIPFNLTLPPLRSLPTYSSFDRLLPYCSLTLSHIPSVSLSLLLSLTMLNSLCLCLTTYNFLSVLRRVLTIPRMIYIDRMSCIAAFNLDLYITNWSSLHVDRSRLYFSILTQLALCILGLILNITYISNRSLPWLLCSPFVRPIVRHVLKNGTSRSGKKN